MRKDDVLLSAEEDRNIAMAICQNQNGVDDKIVRKESLDREGSGQSCDILRVIYQGAVLSVSHTTGRSSASRRIHTLMYSYYEY